MCALLTAILFVQEEALSFIPNVQFSVMLIMAYAATLKFYQTAIIVSVHVFLDNLIMGSLSPTVVLPMFVGWMLLAVLGYVTKKSKLWVVVLTSVLGSLLYTKAFALTNWLVLKVDIVAYLLADVVFDIILCCSSIVTVMFLYQPVCKLIRKNLVKISDGDLSPE